MSIERVNHRYVPICDGCGKELRDTPDYGSAMDAIREEGWKTKKEEYGWENYCTECMEEFR